MSSSSRAQNSVSVAYADNPLVQVLLSYHEKVAHCCDPLGHQQGMLEVALRVAAVIVAPLAYLVLSFTAFIGVCFHACLTTQPKSSEPLQLQSAASKILPYVQRTLQAKGFYMLDSSYVWTVGQQDSLDQDDIQWQSFSNNFSTLQLPHTDGKDRLNLIVKIGLSNGHLFTLRLFLMPNSSQILCDFVNENTKFHRDDVTDLNDLRSIDPILEDMIESMNRQQFPDSFSDHSSTHQPSLSIGEPFDFGEKPFLPTQLTDDHDVTSEFSEEPVPVQLPEPVSVPVFSFTPSFVQTQPKSPPPSLTNRNLSVVPTSPQAIIADSRESTPVSVVDHRATQLAQIRKETTAVYLQGPLRDVTLIRCVEQLVELQEFQQAIDLAEQIIETSEKAVSFSTIYKGLIKLNHATLALQVLPHLVGSDIGPSLMRICPLLNEASEIQTVVSMLQRVQEKAQLTQVIRGTCEACIRIEHMAGVTDVIKAAQFLFYHRKEALYEIGKTLMDAGKYQEALRLVTENRLLAVNLLEGVCQGITKPEEIQPTWDVAKTSLSASELTSIVKEICQACVRMNHLQLIDTVILSDQENGKGNMYPSISKALQEVELLDKAVEAAMKIEDGYNRNRALKPICEAWIGKSNFEKAVEVVKKIEDDSPKRDILIFLGKALANTDNRVALDSVIRMTESLKKDEDKDHIYEFISKAFREADKLDIAVEMAMKIRTSGFGGFYSQGRVLQPICEAWMQKRNPSKAIEVAEKIQHESQKKEVLTSLGRDLAQTESEDGLDLVMKMAESLKKSGDKDDIYKSIVNVLRKADKLEKAAQVAIRIKDEFNQGSALASICEAWIEKGGFDKAIGIAQQINNDHNKKKALIALGRALAQTEKEYALDEVIAMLDLMKNRADSAEAYTSISSDFEKADKLDIAVAVAMHIGEDGLLNTRGRALMSICRAWIAKANIAKAIEVLKKIRSSETVYIELVINEIIKALTSIDLINTHIESLLDVAQKMTKGESKDKALVCICNAFISAGQLDRADAVKEEINMSYYKGNVTKDILAARSKG